MISLPIKEKDHWKILVIFYVPISFTFKSEAYQFPYIEKKTKIQDMLDFIKEKVNIGQEYLEVALVAKKKVLQSISKYDEKIMAFNKQLTQQRASFIIYEVDPLQDKENVSFTITFSMAKSENQQQQLDIEQEEQKLDEDTEDLVSEDKDLVYIPRIIKINTNSQLLDVYNKVLKYFDYFFHHYVKKLNKLESDQQSINFAIQKYKKNIEEAKYAKTLEKQRIEKELIDFQQSNNQKINDSQFKKLLEVQYRESKELNLQTSIEKSCTNDLNYQKTQLRAMQKKFYYNLPFSLLCISNIRQGYCPLCKKYNCDGCKLALDGEYPLWKVKQKIENAQGNLHFQLYFKEKKRIPEQFLQPQINEQKLKFSDKTLNAKNLNTDLSECLEEFFLPKQLTGEDQWFCSKCKKRVDATQQKKFEFSPQYLIIHFKRFTQGTDENQIIKNNDIVKFPLDDFDLTPYVTGVTPHLTLMEKHQPIYNLFGIVAHDGTMQKGHYVSYCKTYNYELEKEDWFKCDDTIIKATKNIDVYIKHAYILFYTLNN